jgi:hypothetical protein
MLGEVVVSSTLVACGLSVWEDDMLQRRAVMRRERYPVAERVRLGYFYMRETCESEVRVKADATIREIFNNQH